jgi:hypothetical protein
VPMKISPLLAPFAKGRWSKYGQYAGRFSGDRLPEASSSMAPWRIYNLGNGHAVEVGRVVDLLESELGRKAVRTLLPLQLGDVPETCAETEDFSRDFAFAPTTRSRRGSAVLSPGIASTTLPRKELQNVSRLEACFDEPPIIGHDIKIRRHAMLKVRKWHVDETGHSFFIAVYKRTRRRVETGDDCQPSPRCRNGEYIEIGTIVLETQDRFPDITGVELRVAGPPLRAFVERNCVVQQDNRARTAVAFQVDEILERLFEEM